MFPFAWHRPVLVRSMLASAIAVGLLGTSGCSLFEPSAPVPWDKPATVNGETVNLTYIGSDCRESSEADVEESSTRVVITVQETAATNCNDMGVSYEMEVELEAPLGNRELVDGACEMPTYADHSECESGEAAVEPNDA